MVRWIILLGLLVGCDDGGSEEPVDATPGAQDGGQDAARDGGQDAAIPDAAVDPDTAVDPDAEILDAAIPDASPDAATPPPNAPTDVVVDVPHQGPYGERTFTLPAATHWASTGLYLRAGETATITADGTWTAAGQVFTPRGDARAGTERGCPKGGLVARSGLDFEAPITCIGVREVFTAPTDGIVYVGMIWSTDLGEAYGERLALEGALEVTVESTGATAPTVFINDLPSTDLDAIESGVLELASDHILITLRVDDVRRDRATATAALATLDAIWDDETFLRGQPPFRGERVRFVEDPTIADFAYMLAGNPIRCVPDLLRGGENQRILRAAEPRTDIWGFAHELGHLFSFANGTWVYQYNNIEVFPNIFTLHALETLERTAFQPNVDTYCNGREAYLAEGNYPQFKDDPFLQLCFLMDFTETFGWAFWQAFYAGIDRTPNHEIPVGGTPEHALTWGFLRDRFSAAAGEDVTPMFEAWRVPLP